MGLIRGVSALVIRCFRRVEHCADAVTGAAGPVFIALAWTLTAAGGFVFFDVVASNLGFWATLFMLPLYILVPLNMYGQYYLVTHVSPGYPVQRSPKDTHLLHPSPRSLLSPERWGWERRGAPPPPPGPAPGTRVRRCRKCDGPKPERAHHCSVCKRCVLQMDHHCPWINTCVGLHNQRHFVLFMTWLTIGCWIVLFVGWPHFWYSIDVFNYEWTARSPAIIFTLVWVLSVAIGFAVPVLGLWHMYMVSRGETSIEGHDNEYLEKKAKAEGLIYLNPYDLGRRRNLELFFNVGPDGYPLATLLFPLLVPPAVNGAARVAPELHTPELAAGLVAPKDAEHSGSVRHTSESLVGDGPGGRYIMGGGDDLTDDEDGGGGWWNEPGNDR